ESGDGVKRRFLDAGDVWLLEGRTRASLEALRPPDPSGQHPSRPASGPVLIDLASTAVPGVTTISGNDPGDHAGIRAIVDLDQDGCAEIVIGAEDSSSRRNTRAGGGEIRIIHGERVLPATVLPGESSGTTIYGPTGGGHLGKAVAAMDLNGDNRPELVIAEPQAGQSLTGRIWVLGGSWKDLFRPATAAK
ncbi:MAG TPA: hypothetical protein VFE84_05030, partial [Patescibacteria group bacterium]|nr:hypothetical protein [Patescibacteria group bacterium]